MRTRAGWAVEQDALGVLDVHRLGDVRRRGARRKRSAEDLAKLAVEAADAELRDVKVALEQALDAVLALDLEERLPGLEGDVGVRGELRRVAVRVSAGCDRDDLCSRLICCKAGEAGTTYKNRISNATTTSG